MSKTVTEVKQYYESCFSDQASRYSRMMNILDAFIKSDSKILDYGCGTGLISHHLYKKYKCKIDAVDVSEDEITSAKKAWNSDHVNWITMDEFSFPDEKYNLIISSQVIEHVHNVGNYLCRINCMLQKDGFLLIGLPNVAQLGLLWRQLRITQRSLKDWSNKMLLEYNKGMNHINAWDTYHFVTLLASCGYALEKFFPCEGVVIPRIFSVSRFKKGTVQRGGLYLDKMNKGPLKNLCYTQLFLFKKVKKINISNTD